MKLTLLLLTLLASSSAFAPSFISRPSSSLSLSRSDFLKSLGAAVVLTPTFVEAMDQELVTSPTEQWETGKPSATNRNERYANARNQLNSNFAPIKRLNLERKSPVTRLDLNSPGFSGYKKTYPGLFGEDAPAPAAKPVEEKPAEDKA
ncbi:hypothetical protein TrST_g12249 [Triparma strigata]|uniref:Uncharacterized protein n=1 Tax=Triparma strigata TaxID=1606541 RepID=A0A9W7EQA3_9STRA|nr:hypothetical protein TrST_g12249 [Triparma strigata]